MLNLVIILGWILAIGCMLYLAKELVQNRLHDRRERRLAIRDAIRAKRREKLIENRRRLMQRSGQAVPPQPAPNVNAADRPQTRRLFGWIAFVLWQGYWLIEIAEQFRKSDRPLQLPYFFLFIVMVVIPYSIYLFSWRRRRRRVQV
ncbi:MAG TPA: hypothetical protein VFP60_18285 [Pseudolabrys sp.]|nr:hypothetical protein [Pseudolabrys sp.]